MEPKIFRLAALRSDNYEERGERRLSGVIYAESRQSRAGGDNYKIGKCNGFNGTDQNKASEPRREKSRCKLNFKMTMYRDDGAFHRQ